MENNTCIRILADPIQIKECKQKLKENKKSLTQLSNVLALAGNDVRLKILYLMAEEKSFVLAI